MNYAARNAKGLKLAMGALPLFLGIAIWQFYLFVTFKGLDGRLESNGGHLHLLIAVLMALLAFVVGFFVLSVLMRRNREDELHITSMT